LVITNKQNVEILQKRFLVIYPQQTQKISNPQNHLSNKSFTGPYHIFFEVFFLSKHHKEEQIGNDQNPNHNFVKSTKCNPRLPVEQSHLVRANEASPGHLVLSAS